MIFYELLAQGDDGIIENLGCFHEEENAISYMLQCAAEDLDVPFENLYHYIYDENYDGDTTEFENEDTQVCSDSVWFRTDNHGGTAQYVIQQRIFPYDFKDDEQKAKE